MALTPNPHGLPPDLQYVLDGACDSDEILSSHHHVLMHYGSASEIDAIFNEPITDSSDRDFRRRRQLGSANLVDYADRLMAQLEGDELDYVVSLGFAHARKLVGDMASFLASWRYEDHIKGGCDLPFRAEYRMSPAGNIHRRAAAHLASPKAIRDYVKRYDRWAYLHKATASLQGRQPPQSLERAHAWRDRFYFELEGRRARDVEAFLAERAPKIDPAKARRERRQRRRVIKRASVMAAAILGASSVSAFARAEPIIIHGQELDFRFRRNGTGAHLGHGGLNVETLDKAGAKLCSVCVYHEDTPALDQLTAFALRIQAGEEREILQTGNLYAVQEGAAKHPVLQERAQAKGGIIQMAAELEREFIAFRRRTTGIRPLVLQHYEDHGALYREAVARVLFGREWKNFAT